MQPEELKALLGQLIQEWESEVVEFKRASNDFDTDRLGRLFSAMSNEANLRGHERAWLVFGVDDKSRQIVGSDYRSDKERSNGLKHQISQDTEPNVTVRNIHELITPEGRVVFFEIPAAPMGIPIAWKGHYYARAGESTGSLGLDKLDEIRAQTRGTDWSAQVIEDASLDVLDPAALKRAREDFARKYANRFSEGEVMGWSDEAFLDRAKVTIDGKLTRTALLLLGLPESAHLLSPHPAQMTWRLEGPERAYQHFGPPFLLNTTALYQRIRNIQMRILPEDALLAVELSKYDQKVVLEALHNCIAHQDYRRNGRIIVTEKPDLLIFENEGSFYEGKPGDYFSGSKTPRRYRNPFLAQAMAELNMIDTMGYGIHEMYLGQARRFFPMPDYDLSDPQAVCITLHGSIVDAAYSRMLIQKTDLPLEDIIALDRVQKNLPIDEEVTRRLKRFNLIEGRKPKLHVSASVAIAADTKAAYIKTRGLDDQFYQKLITDYLEKFGSASRENINAFLKEKLSDGLSEKQKVTKIGNLLTTLRKVGVIHNAGSRKVPRWVISEQKNKKE